MPVIINEDNNSIVIKDRKNIKAVYEISEFKEYYLNHTREETCIHFGQSLFTVKQISSLLKIGKDQLRKIVIENGYIVRGFDDLKIPTELFIYDYKNLTLDEMSNKYKMSIDSIVKLKEELNLQSTKEDIIKKKQRLGVFSEENKQKIKEKREKTNLIKYGTESILKIPEYREKIKKTWMKKYGVDNPAKDIEIKNKIKETNLKNHNGMWNTQTKEFQKKARNASLEKYGTDHPMQNKQVLDKHKNTCLEKYGVDSYSKTQEFIDKVKQTNIDKYGVNNFVQRNIKNYELWNNKEKFIEFIINKYKESDKKISVAYLAEYFNVDNKAIYNKISEYDIDEYIDHDFNSSSLEKSVIEMLITDLNIDKDEIIQRDRQMLEGKEIDIYLPRYNFGIEVDGAYWHSELAKKFQDHNGRSVYSQNKNLLAEKKGIQIFHIFEHEWSRDFNKDYLNTREKIKDRIKCILGKNQNKIFARKCSVRLLKAEEKKIFLNENHIQGSENISTLSLGLVYQNQIIACMCFGHSKYKYNYELTRFCCKRGYTVIGGASKLFKYFCNNYLKNTETVVSYNDISKTSGKLYEILGFKFTHVNSPNYWWINLSSRDIRTRYQEQQAGEVKRMHDAGYVRICDCGTKTWVFTKSA